METQASSLFRSEDLELVRICADYDSAYAVSDHEPLPCISFVQKGVFRYAAGRGGIWMHTGTVLIERGDVEYTITKPEGQQRDETFVLRLLSEEAQATVRMRRGEVFRTSMRSADQSVALRQLALHSGEGAASLEPALFALLESARNVEEVHDPHIHPQVLRLLDRSREYMHANYCSDLRLRHMAEIACMSPFHYARLFKRVSGITPYRYLMHVRVAESKRSLLAGMPSGDCAYASGFSSPSHFTNTFRAITGMSPGTFADRKDLRIQV